eukprot:m.108105 g.108105  ORF g.108105 m.108105 type:complete len:862 (+) comp10646_c0_seq1:251-2836(+)
MIPERLDQGRPQRHLDGEADGHATVPSRRSWSNDTDPNPHSRTTDAQHGDTAGSQQPRTRVTRRLSRQARDLMRGIGGSSRRRTVLVLALALVAVVGTSWYRSHAGDAHHGSVSHVEALWGGASWQRSDSHAGAGSRHDTLSVSHNDGGGGGGRKVDDASRVSLAAARMSDGDGTVSDLGGKQAWLPGDSTQRGAPVQLTNLIDNDPQAGVVGQHHEAATDADAGNGPGRLPSNAISTKQSVDGLDTASFPSVTIFTVLSPIGTEPPPPKDDTAHVPNVNDWIDSHLVQAVAVMSWLELPPTVSVLLFGTTSTCNAFMALDALKHHREASSPRIACVPLRCFREGAPRLDCVFDDAVVKSSADVMLYANADVVLFPDLIHAIAATRRATPNFFLVAKRFDLDMSVSLQGSLREACTTLVVAGGGDGDGDTNRFGGGPLSHADSDAPVEAGRVAVTAPRWLKDLSEAARTTAISHAREGIDVMAFPRRTPPHVPPFLVGRVQWDNWVLLQAITSPDVVAVEASAVAAVVHLNHGEYKASAKKNGTKYNKRLAVYLPHPHIKETKVYHPGTIWLGRLDEVDANLVPTDDRWTERTGQYFSPKALYPSSACPRCVLVRNDQSIDLALYTAHGMAHGRRTVILVRVSEQMLSQALAYHCIAASHAVHNVLFVTSDVSVHARLRYNGVNAVYLSREPTSELNDPIVRVFSFVGKALYDGYNVLLASASHVATASVESLVGADDDIAYPPTGTKTEFLYLRSRGRTFHFASAMAEILKAELRTSHVAPYSWREQELLEDAFRRVKEATVKNAPQYGVMSATRGHVRVRPSLVAGVVLAEVGDQWLPRAEPSCDAVNNVYATLNRTQS